MFQNLLENLKEKFAESQERKRIEKEDMARMQREIDFQAKVEFQKAYKENALQIAIGRAKKDAAQKSGMQKLRAENRLRRLKDPTKNDPSNFFNKFSAYTQANLARREENLKRTEQMKNTGNELRGKKEIVNPGTIERRKPFQPSGFRNNRNGINK